MKTITIKEFNEEFTPGQKVKFTSDITDGIVKGQIGRISNYKNNVVLMNNGEEIFAEEIRKIEKVDK